MNDASELRLRDISGALEGAKLALWRVANLARIGQALADELSQSPPEGRVDSSTCWMAISEQIEVIEREARSVADEISERL